MVNQAGQKLDGKSFKGWPVSLQEADFSHASLRAANFEGVNLYKANFHKADLRGAVVFQI